MARVNVEETSESLGGRRFLNWRRARSMKVGERKKDDNVNDVQQLYRQFFFQLTTLTVAVVGRYQTTRTVSGIFFRSFSGR